MPKQATWACPGPDTRCTRWTVQLSLNLLGSGPATIRTPLRSWISHRKPASLFLSGHGLLLHGQRRSAHILPLNCGRSLVGVKLPCLDGPRRAEWTTGQEMVRADRDKKMKARCHMPNRCLAGRFSTRVHPGIGLPGHRRQHGHQAGPLSSWAGMPG